MQLACKDGRILSRKMVSLESAAGSRPAQSSETMKYRKPTIIRLVYNGCWMLAEIQPTSDIQHPSFNIRTYQLVIDPSGRFRGLVSSSTPSHGISFGQILPLRKS